MTTSDVDSEQEKVARYPYWVQTAVCLLGALLFCLAFMPFMLTLGILPEFLRQLGVGVFVFGLTAFAITYWYSKQQSTQLEALRKELKDLTLDAFDLTKSARDSGIAKIYPVRAGELPQHRDAKRLFRDRIEQEFALAAGRAHEIRELQTIRMMGISLRGFFSTTGDFYPFAEGALGDHMLQFKILMIDPLLAQAGLRSERESQTKVDQEYQNAADHFSSQLFKDIQSCTETLLRFSSPEDKRIETRLYYTAPSCFLIFINESVFVETYHYGRSGVGGLKGGKIPVLEFTSNTGTYLELEGHFEHVWFKSRHRVLDKAVQEEIDAPRTKPDLIEKVRKEFFWISQPTVE